jgi:hypothetical protein
MTPHPNAEYLRALADGKRVMVFFHDNGCLYPLWDCSSTVIMSLLSPDGAPQSKYWSFHIEQTEEA